MRLVKEPANFYVHMITASGLLDADFREVSLDYIALMQATGYLTQNSAEVEQMFRLMVFNVLTGNRDDHAKNFSFLWKDGKWELAPAYDLCPSEGFSGHSLVSCRGTSAHTVKHNMELQFVTPDIDAIIKQQETPETTIERFQRLTGINPCLCPVCKTGRMVAIRELPRIRSPAWFMLNITHAHS